MYEFNSIVGNEQVKRVLINSAHSGVVSHAYIFEGAKGAGKLLTANCFARLLFCKTKKIGCTCHSCIQFDAGMHSDLTYVQLGEKAKTIGVEQIRKEITENLYKKPFEYDRKIYIINNAELMTWVAQNALLKSIEEPPGYAVFILLSQNIGKFLDTVLSRCFILKLPPLGDSIIEEYLKDGGYSEERRHMAVSYCGGSIGQAIELYNDDEFFEMRMQINETLKKFKNNNNLGTIMTETKSLEKFKERTDDFILIALTWFRDILIYKATKDNKRISQQDYTAAITEQAQSLTFKNLYIKLNALAELKRNIDANTPFNMALDAFIIAAAE